MWLNPPPAQCSLGVWIIEQSVGNRGEVRNVGISSRTSSVSGTGKVMGMEAERSRFFEFAIFLLEAIFFSSRFF